MTDIELEKHQLAQVSRQIEDAQNRKDVDAILALITQDAMLIRPKSPTIQGMEAWRKDYERYFMTAISETITTFSVEIAPAGGMAWEYGMYQGTTETSDGPVSYLGRYVTIYRKIAGEWKVALVSLSPGGLEV
jgi:ketosteroid isomerase-like protein